MDIKILETREIWTLTYYVKNQDFTGELLETALSNGELSWCAEDEVYVTSQDNFDAYAELCCAQMDLDTLVECLSIKHGALAVSAVLESIVADICDYPYAAKRALEKRFMMQ